MSNAHRIEGMALEASTDLHPERSLWYFDVHDRMWHCSDPHCSERVVPDALVEVKVVMSE